jgi:hypothetical protein
VQGWQEYGDRLEKTVNTVTDNGYCPDLCYHTR